MAFSYYLNSAMTQPVTGNFQVASGTHDYQFFLGSTSSAEKLQDATSPGVTSMSIGITDANPGSGPEATWTRLALTQAGLDSATPGASLDIGTTILGGVAFSFWVRMTNTLSGTTSSTDLGLQLAGVKAFPV